MKRIVLSLVAIFFAFVAFAQDNMPNTLSIIGDNNEVIYTIPLADFNRLVLTYEAVDPCNFTLP